jgi:hypothetical protein
LVEGGGLLLKSRIRRLKDTADFGVCGLGAHPCTHNSKSLVTSYSSSSPELPARRGAEYHISFTTRGPRKWSALEGFVVESAKVIV